MLRGQSESIRVSENNGYDDIRLKMPYPMEINSCKIANVEKEARYVYASRAMHAERSKVGAVRSSRTDTLRFRLILVSVLAIVVIFIVAGAHLIQVLVGITATERVAVDIALHPEIVIVLLHVARWGFIHRHCESGRGQLTGSVYIGLHDRVILDWVSAQHDGGVDVGRGGDLGVVEEGEDGDEHGFDTLGRGPAFCGQFTGHFVLAWGMQDGDAEPPVWVYVWVVKGYQEPKFCREKHAGWVSATVTQLQIGMSVMGGGGGGTWRGVGVVPREGHGSLQVAAVVVRILIQHEEGDIPFENVIFV